MADGKETGDAKDTKDTKEGPQRRVYLFPTELIERIEEFRKERGLPSEVEAVRRLVDEALATRDTPVKIINRVLEKLKSTKMMTDIAKDVLIVHPKVHWVKTEDDEIEFAIRGGMRYKIMSNSEVMDSPIDSDDWSKFTDHLPRVQFDLDGEIPF